MHTYGLNQLKWVFILFLIFTNSKRPRISLKQSRCPVVWDCKDMAYHTHYLNKHPVSDLLPG